MSHPPAAPHAHAAARRTRDELAALVTQYRAFVRDIVVPLEPAFLNEQFSALAPRIADVRAEAKRRGLWAPHLPIEMGGLNLALPDFAHISAELGWSLLGHYAVNANAPDIGNQELLLAHGSPAQHQRWLLPLGRGEIRSCFSMTEPEFAGSNPVWMETKAELVNGQWIINGHKWFTTAGDGAAFAVVMAITDPDAAPHQRASQIIVPMDTPGLTLVRNVRVMGDSHDGWASHAELRYDDVKVPEESLLGPRGAGFALAQERLGPGRIHHCMRWIGIAERALDLTCRRALSRQLSPGKVLADQQVVQHWIAESRAEIDASRLLVEDTAERMHRDGQRAARERISLIKYHVAGMLGRVLDRAVQVHGALGITDDTPLAFWYRHERGARIYDGPDEVHKTVVARGILKRYGAGAD